MTPLDRRSLPPDLLEALVELALALLNDEQPEPQAEQGRDLDAQRS